MPTRAHAQCTDPSAHAMLRLLYVSDSGKTAHIQAFQIHNIKSIGRMATIILGADCECEAQVQPTCQRHSSRNLVHKHGHKILLLYISVASKVEDYCCNIDEPMHAELLCARIEAYQAVPTISMISRLDRHS